MSGPLVCRSDRTEGFVYSYKYCRQIVFTNSLPTVSADCRQTLFRVQTSHGSASSEHHVGWRQFAMAKYFCSMKGGSGEIVDVGGPDTFSKKERRTEIIL
jgi:hypothetical protein